MTLEFRDDGTLEILAETPLEAFTLKGFYLANKKKTVEEAILFKITDK